MMIVVRSVGFGFMAVLIIKRGIIFCHVDRRMQTPQVEPAITVGNQK